MKKKFIIIDFLLGSLFALLLCMVVIDNIKTETYNKRIEALEISREYFKENYQLYKQFYVDSVLNKEDEPLLAQ